MSKRRFKYTSAPRVLEPAEQLQIYVPLIKSHFFVHLGITDFEQKLKWIVEHIDDVPGKTYIVPDVPKETIRYSVKRPSEISAPWHFREGPEGEILDPEITGIYNDDTYGMGYFVEHMRQAYTEYGIKPGHMNMTAEEFKIIKNKMAASEPASSRDGYGIGLHYTEWYTSDYVTEYETVDMTDEVTKAINYFINHAEEHPVAGLLNSLTATFAKKSLRALNDQLYDMLGLLRRYKTFNPSVETKTTALRALCQDVISYFEERQTKQLYHRQIKAGIKITNALRHLHYRIKLRRAFMYGLQYYVLEQWNPTTAASPKPEPLQAEIQASPKPEPLQAPITAAIKTSPTSIIWDTGFDVTPVSSMVLSEVKGVFITPKVSKITAPTAASTSTAPPFSYANWASNRRSHTPTVRSRGSYHTYRLAQRLSYIQSSERRRTSRRTRAGLRGEPFGSSTFSLVSHASPQPVRHSFDDYDEPVTPAAQQDVIGDNTEVLLSLFLPSTATTDKQTGIAPIDTKPAPTGPKASPAVSNSRFELPPSDHPTFKSGSGYYYETHREGNIKSFHGYEFDGPKYSSPEEFSYSSQSDSRSLSPSITDPNTDFENPDSDTDPDTDSEHSDSDPKSDHGDSVPPSEETDPG